MQILKKEEEDAFCAVLSAVSYPLLKLVYGTLVNNKDCIVQRDVRNARTSDNATQITSFS